MGFFYTLYLIFLNQTCEPSLDAAMLATEEQVAIPSSLDRAMLYRSRKSFSCDGED